MLHALEETIAAIASPAGGAARGIVRLSGVQAAAIVQRRWKAAEGGCPSELRQSAVLMGQYRLDTSAVLPCELYVWPTPRSYTGQPVVELHTLGSPPLLETLLRCLCADGARLAAPGEFTLRAFLAGRLDLTQAEAVLGVIDAADPQQFQVALHQLAGGLAGPLHRLRDQLLDLLAHLEAGFDFADEDLPFLEAAELQAQLESAQSTVAALAEQMATRSESVQHAQVVLMGRPNTGKSSLFNALLGKPGALVSSESGTTRDYLTGELILEGLRCLLIDTAGIECSPDWASAELWQAAQAVGAEQHRRAQVQVVCLDATRPLEPDEDRLRNEALPHRLVVWTKCDAAVSGDPGSLATSSATGQGIEPLRRRLRETILAVAAADGEVVAGTALRCRESLRLASECLARARQMATDAPAEELIAAELRVALEELGQVVGAVYTDDLLDRIFSRFCIGK